MFDNFYQPVDLYCERLSSVFWAEPVNAITNIAFILAALFAYRLWREKTPKAKGILLLIIEAAVVGVGSFIFHTVATHGAMMADVIPIEIFIVTAIYIIFTSVFRMRKIYAEASLVAFLAFNILVINAFGRAMFNGSIQYAPTLVMLLGVGIYSWITRHAVTKEFLLSGLVFFVSLICRSVDQQICPHFHLGTHFMWHVLNSVTMYYVMKGLIKERQRQNIKK